MKYQTIPILSLVATLLFGVSCQSNSEKNAASDGLVHERRVLKYDGVGIVQIAEKYLGTPYRYGGSNPSGFDCSGYAQYVYSRAGYPIPRQASDQYRSLIPIRVPEPGDLVFFNIDGQGVSHVGIYAGNYKFIHSPSTGKNVKFDDMRTDYYRTRYIGSRSIF